jgi:signal transduction histidine kinase
MLADGMVGTAEQQKQYLQTLRSEADRLGHLVENVLAYSRLERNRSGFGLSPHRLGDLLDRTGQRLAERAKQGGMTLEVDTPADVADTTVRTNALALEQVLFNLVDNACKYAGGADDRLIRVTAAREGGAAVLRVCDRGPGIPRPSRGKLFRAFSKSVHEAAESAAPGLGLGLALSRRLARELGGDLRYEPCEGRGACFAIVVPVA